MRVETRVFRTSDVAALAIGAIAGSAGTMALFRAIQSGLIDATDLAVQTGHTLAREAQVMGMPLIEGSSAYWYVARSGGILAYLLLWFAVFWGITMSSKMAKGAMNAKLIYSLHEFFPLLAVIFAALHAAVLLGDAYIQFRVWHLLIPFTSPYEPLWTGLGVLAFYLIVALIASFYLRDRIGRRTWRLFHYLSYIAFLLALVHGVQSGSDSGTATMSWVYGVTAALILFAIWYRILTSRGHDKRLRQVTA